MRIDLKAVLVVATLLLLPLANVAPAFAVALDFGDVSSAYRDGYWDSGHQWHAWQNESDVVTCRAQHHNQYHDINHTDVPSQGQDAR